MGFIDSLRLGQEAEEKAMSLFRGLGFFCCREGCGARGADLVARAATVNGSRGRLWFLEVKRDLWASRSGNLALEYRNPRRDAPSGILSSLADLWVYDLGEEGGLWVTGTARLRKFFLYEPFVRDVRRGGDGNSSFRLYRKDHMLSVFRRIDGLQNQGDLLDVLFRV